MRANQWLLVFLLVSFVGILVEIWAVDQVANDGQTLDKLQNIKATLQVENQVLEDKIAYRESLQYIEQEAKRAGFVPMRPISPYYSP